ncbi:hypothetical protein CYCD_27870 [Tenuifilaceae bacterium CYCD]|nr:hypothetical protein CYCD_27870 [Tenuifilaceae bacterium CYCD]
MENARKNYQDKAHKALDDIFKEINSLEAKAKNASKELSDNMEEKIQQLKAEGEKLKVKLNEMRETSDDSWEEIKDGFEQATNSLRDAFSNAFNKYKDK